jgi:hypothetical protein
VRPAGIEPAACGLKVAPPHQVLAYLSHFRPQYISLNDLRFAQFGTYSGTWFGLTMYSLAESDITTSHGWIAWRSTAERGDHRIVGRAVHEIPWAYRWVLRGAERQHLLGPLTEFGNRDPPYRRAGRTRIPSAALRTACATSENPYHCDGRITGSGVQLRE